MKRRGKLLLTALLAALILTGCGGKSSAGTAPSAVPAADNGSWSGSMYGYGGGEELVETESPAEEAGAVSTIRAGSESAAQQPEKIIYTAQLNLETTEFDQAASSLERLTEDLGGFIESGSVGDRGSGYSWGDYTIRIPAENFNSFLTRAGELCHETWRNIERQNISESYYDTAGRLKTQQIKLERLQTLLAEAEQMADIITIESAISETEWMIEDLSGTLRHYDAQVDYSTIYINLQEVYRLSNVEEAPVSFAGRLGTAFTDGLRAFGNSMEDFAVRLAYSWLWLAAAAVCLVVLIRLIQRGIRIGSVRRKKNRASAPEEKRDDKSEDP